MRTRPILPLLFACLVLACSREEEGTGHGVLVIAVDALRADHLPSFGYDRKTTRALDDLMRGEGKLFINTWSTGSGVVPAHVSLLTGCDPHVARQPQPEDEEVRTPLFNWFVPDQVPRLAEEFLARGWTTGAFVDHPSIAGLRGYRRGFRDFEEAGGEERRFGFEGVATRFVNWLERRPRGERWFGYVHMNDLERMWLLEGEEEEGVDRAFEPRPGTVVPPAGAGDPVFFAVPRPRVGEGTHSLGEYEARYDTALDQLDRSLARLIGRLQVLDRWEHTTIILVGTFGFGFGEAGFVLDSGSLSPVDLHVPLWIRPAPAVHPTEKGRVRDTVSLVDVAPTALELAGIELPPGMHGQSLAPVLLEGASHSRDYAFAGFAAYPGFAVAQGPFLLEVARPGQAPGHLASSWFGAAGIDEEHVVLREASTRVPLGTFDRGIEDVERTLRLRAAGEEWEGWMKRLQLVLHLGPLGFHALEESELRELRDRGLMR